MVKSNQLKEMRNEMAKSPYTLFTYYSATLNAQVVSAVHALDVRKFLAEHPDATPKK